VGGHLKSLIKVMKLKQLINPTFPQSAEVFNIKGDRRENVLRRTRLTADTAVGRVELLKSIYIQAI
jgi:hypothetical protein